MSKSSYEKCYASYPGRSNEINTAREVLQRHGKFCANAVREFAQQADISLNESCSILRCLWRDIELERFQEENEQLRELVKDIWNDACHFDDFWDYVHDDGRHYFENELPHYQERMSKLGIEVN